MEEPANQNHFHSFSSPFCSLALNQSPDESMQLDIIHPIKLKQEKLIIEKQKKELVLLVSKAAISVRIHSPWS